ncbi:MAG: hypothetical protein PHY34_06640 [Patescibacteria group bacterium]|nr:hypothetical protein [Patescibacteria group bacterium]
MDNEIIEVTDQVSTPITYDTLLSLAEQAEKRIDAMNKIKRVAIRLTNRHDWVDQEGKPYLQVSGAEKIARMFGISWRISEPTKDIAPDGHYTYTYKGYFSLAGATIEAIGTRSSKDKFFRKYDYSTGGKVELPPSAIDEGDVKKAAYTNCIGNGITRLLGLRNLTYEDLQEYAEISRDMIAHVEYKKAGKQKDGIKPENAQTITAGISDVRKRSGEKSGKQWTVYTIKCGDQEYKTFSLSIAEKAKEAMSAGLQAEIVYKQTQYGNDVETIRVIWPDEAEKIKESESEEG